MSFNPLPISYCTNAHPGLSVSDVQSGLEQYTVPLQAQAGPVAAGLWLARPVVSELLATDAALPRFRDFLQDKGLTCYTLNTFPFGNFHSERVKENVYLPDWSDPARLAYTQDCARVLSALMPIGDAAGSMSTVPLGFKGFEHHAGFVDDCIGRLLTLSRSLEQLEEQTGRRIRLAIEPEPFCVLETTPETIAFFARLRDRASKSGDLERANRYLGVCYDVCHQSVEFEDVAASVRELNSAGIPLVKIHITCAIRLPDPARNPEAREFLATFAEPKYLHQTMARRADGRIARLVDLTRDAAVNPTSDFADADEWRIHFHVPVNADRLGPLETTRGDLQSALAAVHELADPPHLEVETYTWNVLPNARPVSLVDGLAAEVTATRKLLMEISGG